MKYIPGAIHESFQKMHVIELVNDFNICLLKQRWVDTDLVNEDSLITMSLCKGDLLFVRFFKPSVHSQSYTFIESILSGGKENKVMSECILSREFIVQNTTNGVLFDVITKRYERDKKINSILNESL